MTNSPKASQKRSSELTAEDGRSLIGLAKNTVKAALEGGKYEDKILEERFSEKRGVFVTLNKEGQLRGCIGFPEPVLPLYEACREAATSAAFRDPRFPPVREYEWQSLKFEVSVLTVPERIDAKPEDYPSLIKVGRDGLIIRSEYSSGLLLPQVPTEYGWDADEYLKHLCQKAGLPPDAWMQEGTELLSFQAQVFSE